MHDSRDTSLPMFLMTRGGGRGWRGREGWEERSSRQIFICRWSKRILILQPESSSSNLLDLFTDNYRILFSDFLSSVSFVIVRATVNVWVTMYTTENIATSAFKTCEEICGHWEQGLGILGLSTLSHLPPALILLKETQASHQETMKHDAGSFCKRVRTDKRILKNIGSVTLENCRVLFPRTYINRSKTPIESECHILKKENSIYIRHKSGRGTGIIPLPGCYTHQEGENTVSRIQEP